MKQRTAWSGEGKSTTYSQLANFSQRKYPLRGQNIEGRGMPSLICTQETLFGVSYTIPDPLNHASMRGWSNMILLRKYLARWW